MCMYTHIPKFCMQKQNNEIIAADRSSVREILQQFNISFCCCDILLIGTNYTLTQSSLVSLFV